jgi:hypothetical protein
MARTEAWLQGPIEGIDPYLLPAAHALVQTRLDLAEVAQGLLPEQLWARPGGAASIGFHLRHVAGATDRLLTYARGEALSQAQLAEARAERDPEPSLAAAALLEGVTRAVDAALAQLKATRRESLLDPVPVGRQRLPSNVLGLIFHAAEHSQRHAGQAVTTAKLLRGGSAA